MANCKVTTGFTSTCADLKRVGGVDRKFWVGYHHELDTAISLEQTADINAIDFGSYGGLRAYDGNKFAHSFGSELTVGGGGNKAYKHTAVVKLLPNSTSDDLNLQDLSLGTDLFFIFQDNNRKFWIVGPGLGMTAVTDVQNTGESGDADTRDTVTFEGFETVKPLRFERGAGYQSTLDYLESLEL